MHPATRIIANNPQAWPRCIYLIGPAVVCRNVFTGDWGMPASMTKRARIIYDTGALRKALMGVRSNQFEGIASSTVWITEPGLQMQRIGEILDVCEQQGFDVKPAHEYPTYHCPDHPNERYRRDATLATMDLALQLASDKNNAI